MIDSTYLVTVDYNHSATHHNQPKKNHSRGIANESYGLISSPCILRIMRVIRYSRAEGTGKSTVKLTFKTLGQLVDLDDLSPYPQKELTEVAENAIAIHLGDVPIKRDAELVVSLPSGALNLETQENLPETIRQHFAFRASEIALERVRKKSAVNFGLKFTGVMLAIMIVVGGIIQFTQENAKIISSFVQVIIAGVLTILAWAAIWDTFEAYVLEYRPLVRKMNVYKKAARMNISIEQA